MELVLSGILHHVLVAADASRLQCLTGELLVLIGDQVDTGWEDIHWHPLRSQVEDPYLGVWWAGRGAWSDTWVSMHGKCSFGLLCVWLIDYLVLLCRTVTLDKACSYNICN